VCVVVVGGVKAVQQAVRTGVGIIDGSDLYSLRLFTFFDLSGIGGQGALNEIVGITRGGQDSKPDFRAPIQFSEMQVRLSTLRLMSPDVSHTLNVIHPRLCRNT
jgi:hypothetical protein